MNDECLSYHVLSYNSMVSLTHTNVYNLTEHMSLSIWIMNIKSKQQPQQQVNESNVNEWMNEWMNEYEEKEKE